MVSYIKYLDGRRPIQRGSINEVERKENVKQANVHKRQSQYRSMGGRGS